MSRSKHKVSRYVGEKLHNAEQAARKAQAEKPYTCGWGCGSTEPFTDEYPGLVYPCCPRCKGN